MTPDDVPGKEAADAAATSAGEAAAKEAALAEAKPAEPAAPQAKSDDQPAAAPKAESAANPAPKMVQRKASGGKAASKGKTGDAAKLKKAAAAGAKNVSKREQKKIKSYAKGVRRELTPREARTMAVVYTVSIILHIVVLGALGYFQLKNEIDEALSAITSKIEEPPEETEEPIEVVETDEPVEELLEEDTPPEEETITEMLEPDESPIDLNPAEPEEMAAPPVEETPDAPDPSRLIEKQGDLAGRASAKSREAMREKYGGNAETDAAVFTGLKWLQKQQQSDGSWHFDKVKAGAKAGTLKQCDTGATGMVLLSYLGAGQTHLAGDYKQTVYNGLLYLIKKAGAKSSGNVADLRSGDKSHAQMYAHCIATLALCEAYALTKGQLRDGLPDDAEGKKERKTSKERAEERRKVALLRKFETELRSAAQLSVNFLVASQGKGGGWRYKPRDNGDTSVTGWAVMALHSAFVGGLQVPTNSIRGANIFLTRVQSDGGAQFGYTAPAPNRPGTSAVGLLCRIYLNRSHPGIPKGIQYLSSVGPSLNNMYFNYYATQVLHHWGGAEWEKWNLKNRGQLVQAQRKGGPGTGSWPAAGGHGALGGDMLQTCFCIMTLEVYYRHLPIYRRQKERTDV